MWLLIILLFLLFQFFFFLARNDWWHWPIFGMLFDMSRIWTQTKTFGCLEANSSRTEVLGKSQHGHEWTNAGNHIQKQVHLELRWGFHKMSRSCTLAQQIFHICCWCNLSSFLPLWMLWCYSKWSFWSVQGCLSDAALNREFLLRITPRPMV